MVFVKWFESIHISGDCFVSASDDQILILLRLLIYARVIAFAFATTTKQRCGCDRIASTTSLVQRE